MVFENDADKKEKHMKARRGKAKMQVLTICDPSHTPKNLKLSL